MPASTPDEFAFDLNQLAAAAARYAGRKSEREAKKTAVENKDYAAADDPMRLAKRIARLIDLVKTKTGEGDPLPESVKELSVGETTTAHEVAENKSNDEMNLAYERVLGQTRDFLGISFLGDGIRAAKSVGRIVTKLDRGRQAFGTGFLISPNLLLTNHHVFPNADTARVSTVEFNFQLDTDGREEPVHRFEFQVDRFFLHDEKLDFALVAVSPKSKTGSDLSQFGFLPLSAAQGKTIIGESLNIIQHPLGRMKEVVVRENTLDDLPDGTPFAHYRADTEPGSSGSPVFNDQWEVVALHHSGVPKTDSKGRFLKADGSLWKKGVDSPSDIAWVANEGVRISKLVEFFTDAKLPAGQKTLLNVVVTNSGVGSESTPHAESESATKTDSPSSEPTSQGPTMAQSVINANSPPSGGGSVTLTVPLTITISLGGSGLGQVALAQPIGGPDLTERTVQANLNFGDRKGYDPKFLGSGLVAPLPAPGRLKTSLVDVTGKPGASGFALNYIHYSLMMHKTRRLAVCAAVNLDAKARFHAARATDKWSVDPRIGKAGQSEEANYRNRLIDRGHLVRRADSGWGATASEADRANDDTFFFTNCSQQHSFFNQSNHERQGFILWGSLENHVADQAKASNGKLCVMNGPILKASDPTLDGMACPLAFYKLICYKRDNGKLGAAAFIMPQDELIQQLVRVAPEEEFTAGRFQPKQVSISTLTNETKLDFSVFGPADSFMNLLTESDSDSIELNSLDDVVL